jgi:hypothetical protein
MGKGFLKVAGELYEIGKKSKGEKREFAFRSAISRAYYGVLWYIRELYKLRESEDLHKIALKQIEKKHGLLVKKLFLELKYARIDADYKKENLKNVKLIDKNTASYYIKLANAIIKYIERGL